MDKGGIAASLIGFGGIVFAWLSWRRAGTAISEAREANALSAKANDLALGSNVIAEDANRLVREIGDDERRAREDAQRADLRLLSVRLVDHDAMPSLVIVVRNEGKGMAWELGASVDVREWHIGMQTQPGPDLVARGVWEASIPIQGNYVPKYPPHESTVFRLVIGHRDGIGRHELTQCFYFVDCDPQRCNGQECECR